MNFDDLPVDDAIKLFFEKNDAIKRGDFMLLQRLKTSHPQLFEQKTIAGIKSLLNYFEQLRANPDFQRRYDAFCKEKLKNSLIIIK